MDKSVQRAELAQSTTKDSRVTRFQAALDQAPPPMPETPVITSPAEETVPGILPNAAASIHRGLAKLLSHDVPTPTADIAPTALPTPPGPAKHRLQLAAGTAVIAALGAYVWFVNYPKMAVRIAGARAGVQASFPAFVPSSYSLSGAVAFGSGLISYQLKSPSSDQPLTITEKKTDWDSKSLLENYVRSKEPVPNSVEGQGLTIYLYGHEASWVNRGIWYTLEGTERLNQEQILKIAYSL